LQSIPVRSVLQYGTDSLFAGSEAFLRDQGFMDFFDVGEYSVIHIVKNDMYLAVQAFRIRSNLAWEKLSNL
jgi:hypothetical protein